MVLLCCCSPKRVKAQRQPQMTAQMVALRSAAAVVMQRVQRGKWGRDEAKRRRVRQLQDALIKALYPDQREQAAVHIQRVVRGALLSVRLLLAPSAGCLCKEMGGGRVSRVGGTFLNPPPKKKRGARPGPTLPPPVQRTW